LITICIVIFFVSNAHLTFFKIIIYSFDILPLGTALINPNCGAYAVMLFSNILVLSLKFALPVVAIELVTEFGLGMLMRTVPQINIFVVGLQLKLLVGLVLIVLVFPQMFMFLDNTTDLMLKNVYEGLRHAAT
jgi:flagellar biosynthetic protein FliR